MYHKHINVELVKLVSLINGNCETRTQTTKMLSNNGEMEDCIRRETDKIICVTIDLSTSILMLFTISKQLGSSSRSGKIIDHKKCHLSNNNF